METVVRRLDDRIPLKVTVDLRSLDIRQHTQEGITENVSSRGARVVTNRPWKPNERLNLRSLMGNFKSRARVVYCEPLGSNSFAIGLQLFAVIGDWKSPT
jgi:hypothetical protein